MDNIMLDLETMGNGPQAAIVAIGAVEFDLLTQEIGEKFYAAVDLASSVYWGGKIDASTVMWWLRQSDEARMALGRDGKDIGEALGLFADWLKGRGDRQQIKVWGNGVDFDNVILSSAYHNMSHPVPWEWFNNRCYRTVKKLYPYVEIRRSGTHHNALDDAVSQAEHLIKISICTPEFVSVEAGSAEFVIRSIERIIAATSRQA